MKNVLSHALGSLLIVGLVAGCSHAKKENSDADTLPPPAAEAGTDPLPPPAADQAKSDPGPAPAPEASPQAKAESTPPPAQGAQAAAPSGGAGAYTVKQGDTLMKIAFENYGDLFRWREILNANQDKIPDPNHLAAGTELKIDGGGAQIEHNGDPYLIRHGDTLGVISNDLYASQTQWKRLWENNKQLIKDPNRIYAGFYLYYTMTPEERSQYDQRKGAPTTSPRAPASEPAAAAPAPAPAK